MQPREQFILSLCTLAELCGKALSKEVIRLYDENLRDLGYPALCAAVQDLAVNRKDNDYFPSIRTIRERLQPSVDPETEALEASNRIVEAISKFGYPDPEGARSFIGELGWMVVQREGGWLAVCEHVSPRQIPTLKAQWRDLARALYKRAEQGRLSLPPPIPKRAISGPKERESAPVKVSALLPGMVRES